MSRRYHLKEGIGSDDGSEFAEHSTRNTLRGAGKSAALLVGEPWLVTRLVGRAGGGANFAHFRTRPDTSRLALCACILTAVSRKMLPK